MSPRNLLALLLGCALGLGAFACTRAVVVTPTSTSVLALQSTSTTITSTTTSPTTTAPEPTTTTEPPKGGLVIHGVGDVNLDSGYIPTLATEGFDFAWSGLGDLFLSDDLTVVNLECSPSPLGDPEPKAFNFRCPDGHEEMASAGVEVANLGNNHSQDFGKEAMLDGINRLRAVGIDPVGAGSDATRASIFAPYQLNGWRVAVLGFGGIRPHDGWIATADEAGMADGDTIESMVAAVEAADAWADWVVVSVHWGVELDPSPRPEDIERAQAMIAAGADVIFGHHPHRLQPFEMVDGRPVAWSLGNFVWPAFSAAGAETAVARVEITPQGEIGGCLLPARIEPSGHPVLLDGSTCP